MTMQTTPTTPTTQTTESPDVDSYLAAVREELADLPEADRAELLEDLASHLAEVADAPADDGTDDAPLAVRLGSPAAYASELRAAAGLPPKGTTTAVDGAVDTGSPSVVAVVRDAAVAAWRHPWSRGACGFFGDLRPAWWIARGVLAVAVPAWWTIDFYRDFPIPTVLGSSTLGAVACVVAAIVSVRIGRAEPRLSAGPRIVLRAAEIAIVVAALVLLPQVSERLRPRTFSFGGGGPQFELESRYGPVTNIYPYAADGTPLDGVLLYDQDGRPLRSEEQLWWPDRCVRRPQHPRAADGVPVPFSYPLTYEADPRYPEGMCATTIPRPAVRLPTLAERGEGGEAATTTTTLPAGAPNPAG